jgi:four helix bundle protein
VKSLVSRHRAHEELDVYRLSRALCVELYRETRSFPLTERFGLTVQIRRAAVSIPVNIAEGAGRRSKRDFARFLSISRGSANELFVLLDLANQIGLLEQNRFAKHAQAIERIFAMISGLIRRIDPNSWA